MDRTDRTGLLKVGELARRAGTTVTTVKYYVKEGLVEPAYKTGPNMAYYDPGCVERIRLIKSLQKERYYPLSVIRDLLDKSGGDQREVDLLDAIHKVGARGGGESYSSGEALRLSGLTRQQAAELARHGLVNPATEGRRLVYSGEDLRVMKLARRRLEAGIPFAHTVRSFLAYETALRQAVEEDIQSFIRASFLADSATTEGAIRMIQVSDETLDAFVALRRPALNREYGSRQLDLLDSYAESLSRTLQWLETALRRRGFLRAAARLARAEEAGAGGEGVDRAAYYYGLLSRSRGEEITRRSMRCGQACAFFIAPGAPPSGTLEERFLEAAVRCCWLALAPPVLECAQAAAEAEERLLEAAGQWPGREGDGLVPELMEFLEREKMAPDRNGPGR